MERKMNIPLELALSMDALIILPIIGFCISLYTYITERKIAQNPSYKPFCDISDRISCTKVMKSAYANLFFYSNALISTIFYIIFFIVTLLTPLLFKSFIPTLCLSVLACLASCILGYFLYFRIKTLCLLCTLLYIINFLLLICTLLLFFAQG